MSLSDRQQKYIDVYRQTILPNLPIVVRAKVKNFNRLTRNLSKPFSQEISKILRDTTLSTVMELEGAIFAYQQGSEINFILKKEAYSNDIQSICSTAASLCSIWFMKHALVMDPTPDLLGDCLFEITVWAEPSLTETAQYLFWRQHICISNGINSVLKFYSNQILLNNKSITEKKDILQSEYNINYEDFPGSFKLGSACYKIPTVHGGKIKKKWHLDTDLVVLDENREFILNILRTGQDVFKPGRETKTKERMEQ